jgi:hypothetical protein
LERLRERVTRTKGSFEKHLVLVRDGQEIPYLLSWTSYDEERELKTVWSAAGVQADKRTPINPLPTRADAAAKFVYSRDRVAMWNPLATDTCGSPWVDMTSAIESVQDPSGTDLRRATRNELADLFGQVSDLRQLDGETTTYELDVPGHAGVPSSIESQASGVWNALPNYGTAVMTIEGTRITIEVDITEPMRSVRTISDEEELLARWELTEESYELELAPAELAPPDCLG